MTMALKLRMTGSEELLRMKGTGTPL